MDDDFIVALAFETFLESLVLSGTPGIFGAAVEIAGVGNLDVSNFSRHSIFLFDRPGKIEGTASFRRRL